MRDLDRAQKNVEKEIRANARSGGMYAGALSGEGYAGGYLAALQDVEAMLRHGCPSDNRGYWR